MRCDEEKTMGGCADDIGADADHVPAGPGSGYPFGGGCGPQRSVPCAVGGRGADGMHGRHGLRCRRQHFLGSMGRGRDYHIGQPPRTEGCGTGICRSSIWNRVCQQNFYHDGCDAAGGSAPDFPGCAGDAVSARIPDGRSPLPADYRADAAQPFLRADGIFFGKRIAV